MFRDLGSRGKRQDMAELTQRPEKAENKGRRRMLITLVILLVTLVVVVVKDWTTWFGSDETTDAYQTSPASAPTSVAQAPSIGNLAPRPRARRSSGVRPRVLWSGRGYLLISLRHCRKP